MTGTSTKQHHILIVTTGGVLRPTTGGELRTHHLARALAALGHRVDVVGFVARNHPAGCERLSEGLSIRQRHSVWLDLALAADRARLVPVTELPLWLAPLRGWLRGEMARENYDVVQFDFPWFVSLYSAAGGARVVYNAQNIESAWWGPRLSRRFAARLERHEIAAAAGAAGVAACSRADLEWLRRRAGGGAEKYALAPNGYDAERFRRPAAEGRARLRSELGFAPGEKIAIFCGSHAWPNREAAAAILERIAPGCAGAGVRLVIAGRVGDTLRGAGAPGVTITGPVADVLPWLQAADVALNPMRSGSGSNIKVAEACAAGLPLVTTEFGLRGFESLAPWVRVCEIGDFAAAIGRSAWPNAIPAEILGEYSWAAAARKLAGLYEGLGG